MPSIKISLPVRKEGSARWAELKMLAESHTILGEKCDIINGNYSHFGGHRVRAYKIRKNVHWLLPDTVQEYDITNVPTTLVPRRQQGRDRS